MSGWGNLEPQLLLQGIENGEIKEMQVIDVREQDEWNYYHLPASTHIPMSVLPYCLERLPEDMPLYIVCAHGVRSEAVCEYLEEQGYTGLHNVTGGMAHLALLQGFQYD